MNSTFFKKTKVSYKVKFDFLFFDHTLSCLLHSVYGQNW